MRRMGVIALAIVALAATGISPVAAETGKKYINIGADPVAPDLCKKENLPTMKLDEDAEVKIIGASGKISTGWLPVGTEVSMRKDGERWLADKVCACGNPILNRVFLNFIEDRAVSATRPRPQEAVVQQPAAASYQPMPASPPPQAIYQYPPPQPQITQADVVAAVNYALERRDAWQKRCTPSGWGGTLGGLAGFGGAMAMSHPIGALAAVGGSLLGGIFEKAFLPEECGVPFLAASDIDKAAIYGGAAASSIHIIHHPRGPVGPQGPQGQQGVQGPRGFRGPQGSQGAQGSTGPQGPGGATGAQGPAGPQGPVGSQGPVGAQGPIGPPGSPGLPGGGPAPLPPNGPLFSPPMGPAPLVAN